MKTKLNPFFLAAVITAFGFFSGRPEDSMPGPKPPLNHIWIHNSRYGRLSRHRRFRRNRLGMARVDRKNLDDLEMTKNSGNTGTTNGQDQRIDPWIRADVLCLTSGVLTKYARNGTSTSSTYQAGQPLCLDGRVISHFNGASGAFEYTCVPLDALPTYPSYAAGSGSFGITVSPSGDTTGATDLSNLNALIGAGLTKLSFNPGLYYFNAGMSYGGGTQNGLSLIGTPGTASYPVTQGTPDAQAVNFIDVRTTSTATTPLLTVTGKGIKIHGITFWTANSQAGQGTSELYLNAVIGANVEYCVFEGFYGVSGTSMVDVGLLMKNPDYVTATMCLHESLNIDCCAVYGNATDHVSFIDHDCRRAPNANGLSIICDGGGPVNIWGGNITGCYNALCINGTGTSTNPSSQSITYVSGGGFCGSVHVHGGQWDSSANAQIALLGTSSSQYMQGLEFVGLGITNEGSTGVYGIYITASCKDVIFSDCHINRSVQDNVYINPASLFTTGIKFIGCKNFNPNFSNSSSPLYSCWNIAGAAIVEITDCDFGWSSDYNIGSYTGTAAHCYGVNWSASQATGYTRIVGGSVQNTSLAAAIQNIANASISNQGRNSCIKAVDGYNPLKLLGTQPSTSSSAVTNNLATTGALSPVDVWILIGTTATTVKKNGTLVTGSLTSITVFVHLDVGETVTLSQTTGVTWEWYGQ